SHAAFDLPLVSWSIRPRREKDSAVVGCEGLDLGIELGLEPVGLLDGGPEVIQDQSPGHAAEVIERILNTTNEVICGLLLDRLAVCLAGMAQDNAKDMGPAPLAIGTKER